MNLREIKRIDSDTIEKTYIDADGMVTVAREYDMKNALACIAHNREHAARGKDLYHVASLPLELIEHWRQSEGFDWFKASEKEKRERLNDPNNKVFRVMEVNL